MKSQDSSYITLKDLWENLIDNIWLFVASVAVCVAVSVVYIARTPSSYQRTASILIKEDAAGSSMNGAASAFESMGLVQAKTDINNEIHILSTPTLVAEVVNRLSLNYSYSVKQNGLKWVDLYKGAPFEVQLDSVLVNSSVSFAFKTDGANNFSLNDFAINGEEQESIQGTFGTPVKCAIGGLTIEKGVYFPDDIKDKTYSFSKGDVIDIAQYYASILSVKLRSNDASIIDLSITLGSIQKAEDILNTLISVYNENWIKDKNLVTLSTTNFINERLVIIGQELGEVDKSISTYKSDNLLPDISAVAGMNLQASNENLKQQVALNNQLSMAKYILEYMESSTTGDKLLPVNTGIEAESINEQIATYNELLLKKNSLLSNSSINNPVVADMILNLKSLKEALVLSVNELTNTLSMQISSARQEEKLTQQKISSNPEQELYLLSSGREQKIKEELYLFLLQKREENELTQAFTAYNTKVLSLASGSKIPVAPQKSVILLFGLAIGCILPIVFLILKAALQTSIKSRDDLDDISIPFLGSIPAITKKELKKKTLQGQGSAIISLKGSRDGINEAFRVVRTNLDFMLDQDKQCRTTLVTSFNPKSGKSFIAINLALSMATKDNKVLVIDTDFRRGTLSEVVNSPKVGLVNYLNKSKSNIEELIVKESFHPMLDVLPMGIVPPNPTELLLKKDFAELVAQLQTKYEYIFFDCPPVEIVPDAAIVEKYCDASIFIVRAGLMDKRQLPGLAELHESKKLKNLSLILNGVEHRSRYGYGKYGYGRYGYGGYGYGYGYGSYGNKTSKE
ncbi:MAG: polysaccharide biosynthesis tyrosine autokinase [bacterium]